MVGISRNLLRKYSETVRRYDQNWIDSLRLYVRGGAGGNGLPRVGGRGGNGGSVIFKASKKVQDLKNVKSQNLKQRIIAEDGGSSRQMRLLGETGGDVSLEVPVGVTVLTDSGKVIADLCQSGDKVVVAKGGMGGFDATNFLGTAGEKKSVRLDLKLIGDVGFVGFPNAGKSTLLKALSRARPKIANYPFTTIKPNLGICEFDDLRSISFADLPGLIEGAHMNEGMGHSFLKHVERTRVLMFVVDVNGFQFKADSPLRSAFETVLILNRELELYKSDLLDKPALVVITKMDSHGASDTFEALKAKLENIEEAARDLSVINPDIVPEKLIKISEIVPISAKFSPKTVNYLKFRVRGVIDKHMQSQKRVDELTTKVDAKLSEKTLIA